MATGNNQSQGLRVRRIGRPAGGPRSRVPGDRSSSLGWRSRLWALGKHWARPAFPFLQQHGVNMPFEVVDRDQRQALREGKGFGVRNPNQQSSGQSRTGGHGDGIKVGEGDVGLREGGADDGDDGTEMFAAGQFRNHPAIAGVGSDL